MARKLDLSKPLSAEDVKYLRSRYPEPYVQHQIALAGVNEDSPSEPDEAEDAGDGGETGDGGADGTDVPEEGSEAGEEDETGEEDLIGDAGEADDEPVTSYDPGKHTVDEVNKHLKTVSEEEKGAILALERDGRNRTSIDGI